MGYRLKKDATSQGYQLGAVHDVLAPPERQVLRRRRLGQESAAGHDAVSGRGGQGRRDPGADDPKDGIVRRARGSVRRHRHRRRLRAGRRSTVTYTFADGSTVTQTTTKNADGSITVTRVYSYGGTESFVIPPSSGGKQADTRAKTGRVSWREMIRP